MGEKKELALTKEEKELLTADETGVDVGKEGFPFPMHIKILSRDAQYDQFTDGNTITKEMYGLLYLLDGQIQTSTVKLVDKIEGTMMKNSYGTIIFEVVPVKGQKEDDLKYVTMQPGNLPNKNKKAWHIANPGYTYQNQVKIVIALGTPEEIIEKLAIGESPFAELRIKKTGYGAWIGIGKRFKEARSKSKLYDANENVIACGYKLTLGSEQQEGNYGPYYIPTIDIDINSSVVALAFRGIWQEWQDIHLFGTTKWVDDQFIPDDEVVEVDAKKVKKGKESNMDSFDDMEKPKQLTKEQKLEAEEEVDALSDDDLPF